MVESWVLSGLKNIPFRNYTCHPVKYSHLQTRKTCRCPREYFKTGVSSHFLIPIALLCLCRREECSYTILL